MIIVIIKIYIISKMFDIVFKNMLSKNIYILNCKYRLGEQNEVVYIKICLFVKV